MSLTGEFVDEGCSSKRLQIVKCLIDSNYACFNSIKLSDVEGFVSFGCANETLCNRIQSIDNYGACCHTNDCNCDLMS